MVHKMLECVNYGEAWLLRPLFEVWVPNRPNLGQFKKICCAEPKSYCWLGFGFLLLGNFHCKYQITIWIFSNAKKARQPKRLLTWAIIQTIFLPNKESHADSSTYNINTINSYDSLIYIVQYLYMVAVNTYTKHTTIIISRFPTKKKPLSLS